MLVLLFTVIDIVLPYLRFNLMEKGLNQIQLTVGETNKQLIGQFNGSWEDLVKQLPTLGSETQAKAATVFPWHPIQPTVFYQTVAKHRHSSALDQQVIRQS